MATPDPVQSPRAEQPRRPLLPVLGAVVVVLAVLGALVGVGLGKREARLAASTGDSAPSAEASSGMSSDAPPSDAPSGDPEASVSAGPDTVWVDVPHIVGRHFDEAKSTLERQGFKVNRRDEWNTSQHEGTVLRTSPSGRAPQYSWITVYVASRKVTVPDVRGWDCQDAERKIIEGTPGGLSVNKVNKSTSSQSQHGKVTGQSPNPGTLVDQGSTVRIDCGVYNQPTPTPTSSR